MRQTVDLRREPSYKQGMVFLEGKVAVITGASMGIGEALAKLFADEGASVVLSSRSIDRAEAARQRVGHAERTIAIECDVRNREEVERLATGAIRRFGRIDIWINNAGHGLLDSVAGMGMNACMEMFDTNLFGALHGLQVAAAHMKPQGGGTIINISSVAGHIPLPFSAGYSGTKFALNAMGRAARVELAKYNINVLTVCPGYVKTDFGENVVKGSEYSQVSAKIKGGITAERVARATLQGYLKRKRQVVVPWSNKIFIAIYRVSPGVVEWSMRKLMKPPKAEVPDSVAAAK
jgi:short-subunit dehydrogenase